MTWLHLTDRCNFRCSYCYLPHVRTDLSIETGRAVIDATFRSAVAHNYSVIKVKYAGGEPLLRVPLILELQAYACDLAARYGLSLDNVVLSNGSLLSVQIIEQMKAAKLRLMISLDGLGDFHDRQRSYADGRSTVTDVTRAIELALSIGLMPEISITISGRNAAGLAEIVAWVLERNLPFSLNFYRENDYSASKKDLRFEEDQIIAGMRAAYKVIETNLPSRGLLSALADRANLAVPHLRTCGVGRSYLVFDTQGRIAKCQMDINHPITDVHDPDPLERIRQSQDGILNLRVDEKEGCHDCQWRYWCAGGCPLQTFRATGCYSVPSPNCSIYRTLFPELLRLEGLRLLKYKVTTKTH